ncbi:nitrous oxide reductase accessory protein NosL [Microvirga sp. BT689]|jgi:copper chaperone NosL|uniref:nitrous oxide reductase accessory protein NosL n=1 Tax=Microvirga arvi TaxID=2778731 RepID=UPI001950A68C|nr:nitrous oxide reductase accessory protein NosL [Microvirga arvi]MBM6581836.1 nitrous oxide reductase accessory protein NosL [Microvirga arvi]
MRKIALLTFFAGALALAGCNDRKTAEAPPPPHEMTASAIGHYCGMNVMEHTGPKGQIVLASRKEPVWFSSARDAISFTMLPEEPKDIRAIYVSDMAKAPEWDKPGATNWVDARQASFVIGSRMKGGMGGDEAVPFSDKGAAEKFAAENGGRVVAFAEVPKDYVLGATAEMTGTAEEKSGLEGQHHDHAAPAAAKDGHAH